MIFLDKFGSSLRVCSSFCKKSMYFHDHQEKELVSIRSDVYTPFSCIIENVKHIFRAGIMS